MYSPRPAASPSPPIDSHMVTYSGLVSPTAVPNLQDVQAMFSRMWSRPCDGHKTEVVWRLVLNGFPTADRLPLLQTTRCGCGLAIGPNRIHIHRECTIIQAAWMAVQAKSIQTR